MRVFLALEALVWLPYGLYCLVRPETLLGNAGVGIATPTGASELRAMYGGLQIALGAVCLLGLLRREQARSALLAIGVVTGGLAIARTLGTLIDGGFSSYTATALVFEWGSCLSTAYLSWYPEAGRERGHSRRFRRWLVRYRQPALALPVAIDHPRGPVSHDS